MILGSDHQIDLNRGICLERCLLLLLCSGTFLKEFKQHGVTHAESHGRQIGCAIAEIGEEPVVATAAGDGPEIPLQGKSFKDHSRVIGQPANHSQIGAHVLAQAACLQVGKQRG